MNFHRCRLLISTRFFIAEEGESLVAPYTFSNDRAFLDEFIKDEKAVFSFGMLRLRTLEKGSFGHYSFLYPEKDTVTTMLAELNVFNELVVNSLNSFFNALWFVKDCSCHLNQYMVSLPNIPGYLAIENPYKFSSASGKKEVTSFTHQEIEDAKSMNDKYKKLIGAEESVSINELPPTLETRPYNKSNRLERGMMFLGYARTTDVVYTKIAMYVPLLEALFSLTDETEISHKMAERTAIFIGKDKDDRRGIFSIVKKAYDVRSKLLHGSTLSSDDIVKLTKLSMDTDEVIRRVLVKILTVDDTLITEKKDLEVYFRDLLFAQ